MSNKQFTPGYFTFRDLQEEVANWSQANFDNQVPYHALLGIAEEVGELSHAHLKMEQGIRGTSDEHMAEKVDAVGDILIYLADYCQRSGINLEHAVWKTWQQVKERNWKKDADNGTR